VWQPHMAGQLAQLTWHIKQMHNKLENSAVHHAAVEQQ